MISRAYNAEMKTSLLVLRVTLLVETMSVFELSGIEKLAEKAGSILVECGDDGICASDWV